MASETVRHCLYHDWFAGYAEFDERVRPTHVREREKEREEFYNLCPASSLMDMPGYVNPDKLMNVQFCSSPTGLSTSSFGSRLSLDQVQTIGTGTDEPHYHVRALQRSQHTANSAKMHRHNPVTR